MNAKEALNQLIEGNQRFVAEAGQSREHDSTIRHHTTILEQKPKAVILGCSDSRVPAELVFDQGLGDLFVIRVAGNIVAPSQIGSVEFACQQFGTQLVVVMGHSHCGAIKATVDALVGDPDQLSPNLAAIVDRVTPAVLPVVEGHENDDKVELVHRAMRANIEQSVRGLQLRSQIIRQLIRLGELMIVGAEYSIETGKVEFYPED